MRPLQTIWCILSLSRTFLSQNTKIRRVDLWKNGFYQVTRYLFILGHMLLHIIVYKCGYCEHFDVPFYFLGPSCLTLPDPLHSKRIDLKSWEGARGVQGPSCAEIQYGSEENRFLANISSCACFRSYFSS